MSDIQEEQKRLYKRAEENDIKLLKKELEELRDIFNYEKDLRIKSEKEINRLNNIIDKTNWWLNEMLILATNDETKAIINGALELLLKGDNK